MVDGRGVTSLQLHVLLLDKWGRAESFSRICFFSIAFTQDNPYAKVVYLRVAYSAVPQTHDATDDFFYGTAVIFVLDVLSAMWASPAPSSTCQLSHFLLFLYGCFLPRLSFVSFLVLVSISHFFSFSFFKAPLPFLASFLLSVTGPLHFLSECNQKNSLLRKYSPFLGISDS